MWGTSAYHIMAVHQPGVGNIPQMECHIKAFCDALNRRMNLSQFISALNTKWNPNTLKPIMLHWAGDLKRVQCHTHWLVKVCCIHWGVGWVERVEKAPPACAGRNRNSGPLGSHWGVGWGCPYQTWPPLEFAHSHTEESKMMLNLDALQVLFNHKGIQRMYFDVRVYSVWRW